jgi:hypothetical protein
VLWQRQLQRKLGAAAESGASVRAPLVQRVVERQLHFLTQWFFFAVLWSCVEGNRVLKRKEKNQVRVAHIMRNHSL